MDQPTETTALKRLLVGLWAAAMLAGSGQAANLTPDELTQATSANDTDLFVIYPTGGPLKSLQWSVVKSLMQTALGSVYLQAGDNLADVGSASSARSNLGLGSAAVQNTGTSGANVPLLNGANTWSGSQTWLAGTTTAPPMFFQSGALLMSPTAGAFEWDGANLYATKSSGPTRETLAYADGSNLGANAVALSKLAQVGASTLLGNPTGSTANVSTVALGTAGAAVPLLNGSNSWSGVQTYTNSDFCLLGSSTGCTTLHSANSGGSNFTLTLPAATDTVVTLAATQTLTNKTVALANGSTATTQSGGDASTDVATDQFVANAGYAPLASPALTGTPTAPTASAGTSTTQIATTAFANPASSLGTNSYAKLPSGLIIEGGVSSNVTSGSSLAVTLPLTCPTAVISVIVTPDWGTVSGYTGNVGSITASSFTIYNGTGTTIPFYWQVLCR
jgi:hypothetical protein